MQGRDNRYRIKTNYYAREISKRNPVQVQFGDVAHLLVQFFISSFSLFRDAFLLLLRQILSMPRTPGRPNPSLTADRH